MTLTDLHSLDGNENIQSDFQRPDRYRHLFKALSGAGKVIARGAALSYCNASAGKEVSSVSSLLFNRILKFDREQGIITVEPGLRIGGLMRFAISQGWYFPVVPGHPAITIGGCVAFNVHGKSQFRNGNFKNHIRSIKLFHPDHGEVECSWSQNESLFHLTIGGFGLTGFVTQVELQLLRSEHAAVLRERHKAAHLAEAMELLNTLASEHEAVYSWNDLNKTGKHFGRGIVFAEKFSQEAIGTKGFPSQGFKSPSLSSSPVNFYSKTTSRLINNLFYIRESGKPKSEVIGLEKSVFPLYGHELYFSLFGKKGLLEYSMLIPTEEQLAFVPALEKLLAKSNLPYTLTTMRPFKGEQVLLNFTGDGICLNIDVPAGKRSYSLFQKLDELVIESKGIVNLSKDSRIAMPAVKDMFPEYEIFKSRLRQFDPAIGFDSALRKRIDV